MKLPRASLILLILQTAIVSSVAAKYLYERKSCPRVWTRAVAYDPEMVMRGRYLSMQLHLDACGVTLPPRKPSPLPNDRDAFFQLDPNNVSRRLPVLIGVSGGKLVVNRIVQDDRQAQTSNSQGVTIRKDSPCSDAVLETPVDFYLPEKADSPSQSLHNGQLWVEVTVPPIGPPRPLKLAVLSREGHWQPLKF